MASTEDFIATSSFRTVPFSTESSDIANPILDLSTDGRSAENDHHFPAGLVGLHDAMCLVDLLEGKHT